MITIEARLPDGNIHKVDLNQQDNVRALKLLHQPQIDTSYDNIGVMYNNTLVYEHTALQSLQQNHNQGLSLQLIRYDQYFKQWNEKIGQWNEKIGQQEITISNLQQQLKTSEQQYAKLNDEISALRVEQVVNQDEAQEIEIKLTQQILDQRDKLKVQEDKLTSFQKENTELKNALQNLQNRSQYESYNSNQMNQQINQQFNQYRQEIELRMEELNNELQNKKIELNKVSEEYRWLKDSHDQMQSHNKLKIDDLNKEVFTLKEKLKLQTNDIYSYQQNGQNDVDEVEQQLRNVKSELKKTRAELIEQSSIASRVPQLENILKQEQNNLNMTRYNSNQTIAELSNTIQSLEKAKFELENKLRKAEKDKSDSDMKNQQKLKDQEVDIQGLKNRLQNLTSEKNDLQQEKAQLIEQKTKALSELEKQADSQSKHKENEEADLRKKNKTLNIEKTRLETVILENNQQIQNLKNQIDIQDQSIAKSTERFNQVMEENKQANDIMQSKNDYQDKVIKELNKKIPNHYKPKILGVVEQLKVKYAAAITDFAKDPSGSLTEVKFKIWKVEINQKELEKKLIQEGNLLINDLVKLTALADIEGKRTVNAIVSNADHQQGFIFQNSKPDEQVGLLLLRQFKDLPPHFDNKEAAAQQVINNLLVDFMINDLNNQLVAQKDPKFDVKVAPQYVVQIAGEPKFYHAELLIDGPFTKFNGGEFALQASEQGQIANTLTYYSFKRTRGKLCISHLQSLGNTYYDAIVSSEYGLIGQADLGPSEIHTVVDKIDKGKPEFLHPTFAKIRHMFEKK